ncbi:MAG: nucleoside diphosphate kinase regulator [Parcubacteria group bacterium]|jgi:regulator of nucleoside diphosphate kinase|nr:nucleoside diphosphate kinase regulator [Parcubacteria group bacterium]
MNTIYITKNDYEKLMSLINEKSSYDEHDKNLLAELGRATIVASQEIPNDVITMNSLVIFSDTQSGNQLEYWLVFPEDADITQKKISIFSPIGCALLGYKIGDLIEVDIPGGKKKLKVEKILHQPEAEGNYE